MDKQAWYKWHSLAGIKLSILICLILVTGTLAVVSHEIDWLLNPSKRVLPAVEAEKINWSLVYQSATQKSQGSDKVITGFNAPIDDWFAVEVILKNSDGNRFREYYHPETGEYQGSGRWYNWQRFFRMMHRHLMMPTIVGITIVCLVGLVMFFSLISGLFMFPKWWRNFFRKPRTSNKRVFWNDCHRLFGLWSAWLLLVVCITGIWYLIELWGGKASFPEQNNSLPVTQTATSSQPSQMLFNKMIDNVALHHDMKITRILMPSDKNPIMTVQGQNETILVRDRANNVIFNPQTGEFMSRRFAQEQSLHVRISEAADPLHFGTFYGIYTKLIYFVFGIALSALAISGTYLYGLRFVRQRRNITQGAKPTWYAAWQGMKYWRWPSLLLIAISLILAFILFTEYVVI